MDGQMHHRIGTQYQINDVESDFGISEFDGTSFVEDSALTNIFEWTQKVLGIYGTASYERDK